MATCMQHLYMIPEARKSVIEAVVSIHDHILCITCIPLYLSKFCLAIAVSIVYFCRTLPKLC